MNRRHFFASLFGGAATPIAQPPLASKWEALLAQQKAIHQRMLKQQDDTFQRCRRIAEFRHKLLSEAVTKHAKP